MIPIFLHPAGCLCVVIGGGEVGRRKARVLLEGGASVRLVCLEEKPFDFAWDGLDWITAPYAPEHLDGATLVFAAATPELNRQVVKDARSRGLLVNAATEPESGDFFMPAVYRRGIPVFGELTIAVGTGGMAPAVARTIRNWLAEQIDAAFTEWLGIIAELRPEIHVRRSARRGRDAIFQFLCEPAWLQRLRNEPVEQVRQAMRMELEHLLSDAQVTLGDCGQARPSL